MSIIIGHRGAMGYEPENTLKSFRKALQMKAEAIELDVYKCKSGEIVVIHDSTLGRTTNGQGEVESKTLEELKRLNAGKGEKIPTLQEVLEVVNKKAVVNIELKGEGTAFAVCRIIEEYIKKEGWKYNDFIVSSFSIKELYNVRRCNKNILTGFLISKRFIVRAFLAKYMNLYSVHLKRRLAKPRWINYFHKQNLKVFAWTVNDIKEAKKLNDFGIDGLITDFPDKL